MTENLEAICKYAIKEESCKCKECCKCNLKIYDTKIECYEPYKWNDCYFFYNYNSGKICKLWSENGKESRKDM